MRGLSFSPLALVVGLSLGCLPGPIVGQQAPESRPNSDDNDDNGDDNDDNGDDNDDIGAFCDANDDCDTACLFGFDENGNQTDFGYCTKRCDSFADCPTFWSCEEVGNANGTFCIED